MEGPQTVGCPGNLPDLAGSKRPAFRLCSRCKGRRNQRIICCKSPEKGIEPIAYCEIAGPFAGFEIQKYGADPQKIVGFPSVSSPLLAPFFDRNRKKSAAGGGMAKPWPQAPFPGPAPLSGTFGFQFCGFGTFRCDGEISAHGIGANFERAGGWARQPCAGATISVRGCRRCQTVNGSTSALSRQPPQRPWPASSRRQCRYRSARFPPGS